MQQKVQFIGTLLHDPELVILDEPFSGLDPINAQALKDTVVELRARGKTVIFSTHLMDNAERLCDSVCIIARGEKVLDGGVQEVKAAHGNAPRRARPRSRDDDGACAGGRRGARATARSWPRRTTRTASSRSSSPPARTRSSCCSGSWRPGASITRFELVQPSLHQIFLEKVGATGVEAGMTGHG